MDWIGYLASAFLALSLLVSNTFNLLYFNTLGCLIFIVYGALIHAFPVILSNSILLGINFYQLWKLSRIEEEFLFVPVLPENRIVQFLKVMEFEEEVIDDKICWIKKFK